MARKKNTYVDMDLEWLEAKAQELKDYCDDTPIVDLKDRIIGGKLMATIEKQIACIRETLKDYASLVEAISKLREIEDNKKSAVRGDQTLSPLETKQI